MSGAPVPTISGVSATVYRFPTPEPEADGTLSWDATTAVVVQLQAGGQAGLGWTYGSPAAATVITEHLADAVRDREASDIQAGWDAMRRACRNLGTKGLVMQAISAVDIAWWDLKARLLDVPLAALFGCCRSEVPVYGSGGFTSMNDDQLAEQVAGWKAAGCTAMKIKIGESWGTRVERDLGRVDRLRSLAGGGVTLMADANGAYSIGLAKRVGTELDAMGVTWFEEPVSSQDTAGLSLLRGTLRCDITAGEYASDSDDIRALLPVLDCVQLDVTRCGGYTGWLAGAALAHAHHLDVSAHCAPSLHAYVAAAIPNLRHVEWFADHARLEPLLVDGLPEVRHGALHVQTSRSGHGMSIRADAARWCVAGLMERRPGVAGQRLRA